MGYEHSMKIGAGVLVAAGIGYLVTTGPGRRQWEHLVTLVQRSRQGDPMADKAKAVIDLSLERAKDVVESVGHARSALVGAGRR